MFPANDLSRNQAPLHVQFEFYGSRPQLPRGHQTFDITDRSILLYVNLGQARHIADEMYGLQIAHQTRQQNIPDLSEQDERAVFTFSKLIEGSLETKVPTMWTDAEHSQEEAEPGRNSDLEKVRREKIRDLESQKREDAGARKGSKVAKHGIFPLFCGSGGSKSRLAKAAGAEPAGQMKGEKLHTVAARSTFRSQNA